MIITVGQKQWGTIEMQKQSTSAVFTAQCEQTDRVMRVWGISDGREPLLIGIPEPDGGCMRLKKRISAELLKNCGYWDEPPESYIAGETIEQAMGCDTEQRYAVKKCRFCPTESFEFADRFCFCRIRGETAELLIDTDTGRPVMWQGL